VSKEFRRSREQAQPFVDLLTEHFTREGIAFFIGGSWRRGAPTIGDLDVVVVVEDGRLDDVPLPKLDRYLRAGSKIVQGELLIGTEGHMRVDFWAARPNELGAFLMFVTGPKELNVAQRSAAIERGWSLSQVGLLNEDGQQVDDGSEADIYAKLGQPFLTPEERQAFAGPTGDVIVKRVQGKSGVYTLTIKGSQIVCSCPGYTHRQKCRHVDHERGDVPA
jgi:DNA polymerase/3'-5' exonuclease PolX